MIYLITGSVGTGKTSLMVHDLLTDPIFKGRDVYVDGIPDLVVPHLNVDEVNNGGNWDKWLPEKAIIVIDECQRYFPKVGVSAKIPDAVAAMNTHRHKGIDIFLITQSASIINNNICALITTHRHIMINRMGRWIYEWTGEVGKDSKESRGRAKRTKYKLDKKTFDLYRSSVEHTGKKVGLSWWFYLIPILLVLAGVSAFFGLRRIAAPEQPAKAGSSGASIAASAPIVASSPSLLPTQVSQEKNINVDDYVPSVDGKVWTAPIYNNKNREVMSMPYPVACVQSSTGCNCYTEQGSLIEMRQGMCKELIRKGIFNPYKSDNGNNVVKN